MKTYRKSQITRRLSRCLFLEEILLPRLLCPLGQPVCWLPRIETNGALIGYDEPDFVETTIVHSGDQSVPYFYNNIGAANYSEAGRTLDGSGRDWTAGGVAELSIWFRGEPDNDTEPLYVAVSNTAGDSAVVYHDDPNAVQTDTWTEWVIPLQEFAEQGVDLTDVDWIAIGFGIKDDMTTAGGSGKMYFDDILLY